MFRRSCGHRSSEPEVRRSSDEAALEPKGECPSGAQRQQLQKKGLLPKARNPGPLKIYPYYNKQKRNLHSERNTDCLTDCIHSLALNAVAPTCCYSRELTNVLRDFAVSSS